MQLRDRATRTVFVVVDAHLQPYKGRSKDLMREAQTKKLISDMARANPNKFPVIYAGDFNSNKSNADQSRYPGGFDAPLKVFTGGRHPRRVRQRRDQRQRGPGTAPTRRSTRRCGTRTTSTTSTRTAAIEARQFKVIVSIDGSRYATPFATDHNPVRATLRIPGR